MASEPENPTVVVGGWIGASRTQSAAAATAGDALTKCRTKIPRSQCTRIIAYSVQKSLATASELF